MAELVGLEGCVVTRIPGGASPGEVIVRQAGESHKFIAFSSAAIPAGTTVWVTSKRGGHQVDVEVVDI